MIADRSFSPEGRENRLFPRWAVLLLPVLAITCRSARLADLEAPQPVPPGSCVVIGFLGGRDRWDDATKGVRRLAIALRDGDRRIYAETFENRRVDLALDFVRRALDADGDGSVEPMEADRARLVVYGQSLGGWATVVFARLLAGQDIPIRLTIQMDSVGPNDGRIPPNVRDAANFYQDEGRIIAGENPIVAADPSRTRVLGNWELDYDRSPGSVIRIDDLPWHKTIFRADHARMDRDPRVWAGAERLIQGACEGEDLRRVVREP